jgi:DDE family transposase/uncharacterized protein DUF4372
LSKLPRGAFNKAVKRYDADRYCKSFDSWGHLVAMVYAQVSKSGSLRDIATGFNTQSNHHYHLGAGRVTHSTLADANKRRDWRVFGDTAKALMRLLKPKARREYSDLLFLIDSTTVSLKGRGFDEWAEPTRVRSTQGLKLHMMYEHNSELPWWQSMTATNVNDLTAALVAPIERGATYVFDKAYCDFNWWHDINAEGARFVTRFKTNVRLEVVEERKIAPADEGVLLKDQVVRLANRKPGGGRYNRYVEPLRRIEVAREGDTPLVFASNDLTAPAAEIAALYKERWAVELFFKWIKQNLNIKKFCARSENAVRIQVMTALITYLLLVLEQVGKKAESSLRECLTELAATLFDRVGLRERTAENRRRRTELRAFKAGQIDLGFA